jgi:GntR family transcriptional regulator, vanillate catabolism transcriptional regulator
MTGIAAGDTPGPKRAGSAEVGEHIRLALAEGRYAPGQRLVEADLSRVTGASRAHVREALRHLRAEGLIEIEEFRGAIVKRLTREEIYAVGRVREALEGLAARLLAERGVSDAEQAALRAIRARLSAAAEAIDYADYSAANEALHAFIIHGCGNEYLASSVSRLRLLVKRTQHITAFREPEFLRGNLEHLAIIDAILLGAGEIAEAIMRMHVRKGTEMIDRAMGKGAR